MTIAYVFLTVQKTLGIAVVTIWECNFGTAVFKIPYCSLVINKLVLTIVECHFTSTYSKQKLITTFLIKTTFHDISNQIQNGTEFLIFREFFFNLTTLRLTARTFVEMSAKILARSCHDFQDPHNRVNPGSSIFRKKNIFLKRLCSRIWNGEATIYISPGLNSQK